MKKSLVSFFCFAFKVLALFGQQDSYYFKLDLATFLFENGKQKEAITMHHELIKDLKDKQKPEEGIILLDTYNSLIIIFNELNRTDSSDFYFFEAYNHVEKWNLQNNESFQYRILGFVQRKLENGDNQTPIYYIEYFLNGHLNLLSPKLRFSFFFYLCSIYLNNTDSFKLYKTLDNYEKELRRFKFEKIENFLKELKSITMFYKVRRDFDKEILLNTEILNISLNVYGENSNEYLMALKNQAVLHHNLSNFYTADSLFNKCVLINEKIVSDDVTQNLIDIYAAQINSLIALGENQKINYLSQIIFRVCIDTSLNCTTVKNNLGLYYISVGNYQKANELLSSMVNEMKVGSNIAENILYVKMQMNNADALNKIGESTKALKIYLDCIELLDNKNFLGAEYVQLLIKVAEFGVFRDFKNAHIFIELGLQIISKDINKFTKEFANLSNLSAIINMKNGDIDKSIELYNISFNALKEFYNDESLNNDLANIRHNLGICYELKNDPINAYKNYKEHFHSLAANLRQNFSFMSEAEMELNLINFSYYNSWLKNFYYRNGHTEESYNLELFEKDILLQTLIKRKKAIKSNPSQNPVSDDKFISKTAEYFRENEILASNEVLIEFSSFRCRILGRWTDSIVYIANVLKPGMEKPFVQYLFDEKQISEGLIKKGIKESTSINQIYNNEFLYQILWKKLEALIPKGTKIYYSPSGIVNMIQLAAIKTPSGEYLADVYQFELVRSTGLIQKVRNEKILQDIAIFGGMDYEAEEQDISKSIANINKDVDYVSRGLYIQDSTRSGKWSYLPGTKKEAENIYNISKAANISAKLYLGTDAIEEQYKNLDGDKSPSILHIATHGFFFPDPKISKEKLDRLAFHTDNPFTIADNPMNRSGLLFSGSNKAWVGDSISLDREDGILTAYEASHTYLKNTELVVLSACETGLGEIKGSEGVYGLQRAFKMAGARYLMMSLWKVPDNATQEFMTTFYTELLTNKKSIRDAYNATQKHMRDKYRDEPYKWAGFVLME